MKEFQKHKANTITLTALIIGSGLYFIGSSVVAAYQIYHESQSVEKYLVNLTQNGKYEIRDTRHGVISSGPDLRLLQLELVQQSMVKNPKLEKVEFTDTWYRQHFGPLNIIDMKSGTRYKVISETIPDLPVGSEVIYQYPTPNGYYAICRDSFGKLYRLLPGDDLARISN